MKTLKKIGGVIVDILILLAFLISIVIIISNINATKNKTQPNVFGYVLASVQTDSMQGTINVGDIIIGKMIDANTVVEKNDIVSFNKKIGNEIIEVTHRVIEVEKIGDIDWYTTRGDNEDKADYEQISKDDINSIYKFRIPFAGKFIDFLKTPFGFVLCLVVPMLAFIAYQIYKLIAIYLQTKKQSMLEEVKDNVSDEAKEAIIQEYLSKLNAEASKTDNAESNDEQKTDDGE